MSLLIRNARVIDPASSTDAVLDIAVEGSKIAEIGPNLPQADATEVIDATDMIACPGLIDPHVHLREPGQTAKEDIASGTRAAVAGGFTAVCCMPNTTPALDSPELVEWVRFKAEREGACRVFPVAAATKNRAGEHITEINLLKQAGAVAISDDGDVVADSGMMRRVLLDCAHTGLPFMQHCQDPSLTRGASMHDGPVAARLGLIGWPRVAEEVIIERDLRLNRDIGARYHVQHISSAGSVDIVRQARAAGLPITAEASPHHLSLTDQACEADDGHSCNTNAKMNPPIREPADRQGIIEGVVDGTITILATDHAPHTEEEKAKPFEQAPFGIIGLESALSVYNRALVESGMITWPKLIEMMTINPARLCNLDRQTRGTSGLGELFLGGPADITILNPHLRWSLTPDSFAGKSRNSPFLNQKMTGRAICTIVGGTIHHHMRPAASASSLGDK